MGGRRVIDFRYHLVSLVSVFLALAVGIVLGAGPLREQIGDTITEQVTALRQSRDDLNSQLDTAKAGLSHRDDFVAALTPATVAERLTGRSVVLLALPGAESTTFDTVTDSLQAAGASVTGRVSVTGDWTAADRTADRNALVTELRGTLGTAGTGAAGDAGLASLLARALVAPTTTIAGQTDAVGQDVLDRLQNADLVDVDGDVTGRATGVVVIAPPVDTTTGSQATATGEPTDAQVAETWSGIASTLETGAGGAVVMGPPSSATGSGLVAAVRADQALSRRLSTVDVGGTSMGDLVAVLALDEQYDGVAGAYGFGDRATAPLPDLTTLGTTP